MNRDTSTTTATTLQRRLGLFGATMMGLGSIVGTGVFVSIGIAAGITGPSVVLALVIAGVVAVCNGLSSAQLAAAHPVSGGTYAYGYRYLNSWLGFVAGWTFLVAKSASAATAALGFAGYLGVALGLSDTLIVPLAVAAVALFTAIVLGGISRSSLVNIVIVSITLVALLLFVVIGALHVDSSNFVPFFSDTDNSLGSLFHAAALMFVAYTGYGRIATMGEEVHEPRRTIPRAIVITMLATMTLYVGVAIVGVGAVGADGLSGASVSAGGAAPLAVAARAVSSSFLPTLLTVGAITAMLGVLLNLIIGLSRVLLAMGRNGDMPSIFSRLDASGGSPTWAVIAVGVMIGGLAAIGNVKTTWSFSAFSVLIYYAITNLAALRLSAKERLYPRWIAIVGLCCCLFLAFWVERDVWLIGLGVIALALAWHWVARRGMRDEG